MEKTNNKNSFPLLITNQGNIIFPGQKGPLEFVDQFSSKAAEVAVKNFEGMAIVTIENSGEQKDKLDSDVKNNLNKYGVLAKITIMKKWNDGTVTVDVDAKQRVEISNIELIDDSYLVGAYTVAKDKKLDPKQQEEFKKSALKLASLIGDFGNDLKSVVEKGDYENLDKTLGSYLEDIFNNLSINDKKITDKFLQDNDPLSKIQTLLQLVLSSIDTSEIENDINKKMKSKIDGQQKEFYLREKLKAIKDELGEDGVGDNSIESYKKRLETEPFPQHVKERILNEIDKFEGMQASSAEGNIQRSYIDWMMQIPWYEKSEDKTDLDYAKQILDEDHYGLEKIKDRIIEYLAAKQKTGSVKGQIITLVGPPGVGKTSLAKSIAKAIGRNFVKVSLGGVRDEAEIRGHRRTYVGAMPGRIIQSMKRAKTTNPVFLLDEIDKMASDYKGDPSSAMLEVLDPEQNTEFSDNYIEEPYDLGDVMFIATANDVNDIPAPLYDRMEVISLSSYTEFEKVKIAKEYLIPKVLKEYKLSDKELVFTDKAIEEIIEHYAIEAGVRKLEREISTIARKFIVKQLKDNLKEMTVTPEVVVEMLGNINRYENTKKGKKAQVGVVTGLAWTAVGGTILPIEVNYFPGKGNLVLTGQLGDVMKESATIAMDYVKANYEKFGIDKKVFEENDIHIHAPEGATPKDGPSAGITLTTAIISALTKKPVSDLIGMTGEVTLQGHVLPIGGLREKSIGAAKAGLKKILIPWDNKKNIEEIPEEVQKQLIIKPMKEYDDVYKEVFETPIDK